MSTKQEDWIQKKWRPMMAVMYMIVCIFDFVLFPIMFTVVQFWEVEAVNDAFRQWIPITLGGGGLFHVAMGAVLGVTAWSRGQEKIAGTASNLNTNVAFNHQTQEQNKIEPLISKRDTQTTLYSAATTTTNRNNTIVVGYGGKPSPANNPEPLI